MSNPRNHDLLTNVSNDISLIVCPMSIGFMSPVVFSGGSIRGGGGGGRGKIWA